MSKGSENREFPPSLLFQKHFTEFSFVLLPGVMSPCASFGAVSHHLVPRLAVWLVVLDLVSSGFHTGRGIGVQWCVLLV